MINKILNNFKEFKGNAYCNIINKDIQLELILVLLELMYKKNNNLKVMLIVNNYKENINIINKLKTISKIKISILSEGYMSNFRGGYDLAISIGINEYTNIIEKVFNITKFKLMILTANTISSDVYNKINNNLKNITYNTDNNKLNNNNKDYNSYPVEGEHILCYLSNTEKESYDKYTTYINNSMTIFNDFYTLEYARNGNNKLNMSANDVCWQIAKNNGWHEQLDLSYDYNKQIDNIFNPNALLDRAHNTYNIIRERQKILIESENKLDKILEIVNNNINKKILIISKNGKFANKVFNKLIDNNIPCGEYHNEIESTYIYDHNNKPILYKSGKQKGQPKIFASKAISTMYEKSFNNEEINILSIKNASDKALKIEIDIIIITSTLCDDINSILYRYNNITIKQAPLNIYKLYYSDTIELKLLEKDIKNKHYKVKNTLSEKDITFNENNSEIILDIN